MDAEYARRPFVAEWILRICFATRCLALGNAFLWNRWERDSDLFGVMLFDWQWPERTALLIENSAIWLMVVAGLIVLVAPWHSWLRRASVERAALVYALVFELLFALALTVRGGTFYSELTLLAHALRIAMPLSLLCLLASRRNNATNSELGGVVLVWLRYSIAVTFIAHGWKAWKLSPEYTTLILAGWQNVFGSSIGQATAEAFLKWIGGLDVVFGLLVIVTRWRFVFLYLIVWGTLSAAGRTVGGGWLHYPETLLRVAHAGGPLALYLAVIHDRQRSKQQATTRQKGVESNP